MRGLLLVRDEADARRRDPARAPGAARSAAQPPSRRCIAGMVEVYAPYTELSCRFDDSGAQALPAEHMPRLREMVADSFAGRARPA